MTLNRVHRGKLFPRMAGFRWSGHEILTGIPFHRCWAGYITKQMVLRAFYGTTLGLNHFRYSFRHYTAPEIKNIRNRRRKAPTFVAGECQGTVKSNFYKLNDDYELTMISMSLERF